jgi:hypothetical protein
MRASPDISKGETPDRTTPCTQLTQGGCAALRQFHYSHGGQILGALAQRIVLFLGPSIVATVIGCAAWYLGWPAHTPIGLIRCLFCRFTGSNRVDLP